VDTQIGSLARGWLAFLKPYIMRRYNGSAA